MLTDMAMQLLINCGWETPTEPTLSEPSLEMSPLVHIPCRYPALSTGVPRLTADCKHTETQIHLRHYEESTQGTSTDGNSRMAKNQKDTVEKSEMETMQRCSIAFRRAGWQ